MSMLSLKIIIPDALMVTNNEFPDMEKFVVIFDMENVSFLNSIFYGFCIMNRDRIILLNPNRITLEVLETLSVCDILNICHDKNEAIRWAKNIIDN